MVDWIDFWEGLGVAGDKFWRGFGVECDPLGTTVFVALDEGVGLALRIINKMPMEGSYHES